MIRSYCKYSLAAAVAVCCALTLPPSAQSGNGVIAGTVRSENGDLLKYANVVVVGTSTGAMTLEDGKFVISNVPPGTYTVKAMMMGYKAVEVPGVAVQCGAYATVHFRMGRTMVARVRTIVAYPEGWSPAELTNEQAGEMPVKDVLEAVALKAGIVRQGGEMRI